MQLTLWPLVILGKTYFQGGAYFSKARFFRRGLLSKFWHPVESKFTFKVGLIYESTFSQEKLFLNQSSGYDNNISRGLKVKKKKTCHTDPISIVGI